MSSYRQSNQYIALFSYNKSNRLVQYIIDWYSIPVMVSGYFELVAEGGLNWFNWCILYINSQNIIYKC